MPSERILNKLFEIAQENTSEEVDYNDFVKDILSSADLNSEEKTYNAEDEYLRNLLAFAKHDSRIFGEYRNGKFVISESIINSAKKETRRNISIRKTKINDLKLSDSEKSIPFKTISEMIKMFEKLDSEGKINLVRSARDMTREQFNEYANLMRTYAKNAVRQGNIKKEQEKIINDSLKEQEIFYFGTTEEKEKMISEKIESLDPEAIDTMGRMLLGNQKIPFQILNSCKRSIYKHGKVENYEKILRLIDESLKQRESVPNDKYDSIGENERFCDKFIDKYRFVKMEDIITHIEKINENEIEETKRGVEVSRVIEEQLKFLEAEFKPENLIETRERIDTAIGVPLDRKIYHINEESLEEYKKKMFSSVINIDIEERKAAADPVLADIGIFDDGFEELGLPASGDLMSAFGEFTDASPVTDVEFAEAFDVTEIGRAKTEEPKTVDTALEEEPGKGEGSGLPSSITIEKINSDAVSPVRKDDKLETKSVIKFAETFVKSSSYLKKMKDVKEFAHAGIDNNKSTEIGDIA